MSARVRFKKGQRVQMSRYGYDRLFYGLGRIGTVRGVVYAYGRSPLSVSILRDGHKAPESYHVSFWEPQP